MIRFQQNEPGEYTRLAKGLDHVVFGNLAVLIPFFGMVDPLALRPRLSTGLPFRILFVHIITKA